MNQSKDFAFVGLFSLLLLFGACTNPSKVKSAEWKTLLWKLGGSLEARAEHEFLVLDVEIKLNESDGISSRHISVIDQDGNSFPVVAYMIPSQGFQRIGENEISVLYGVDGMVSRELAFEIPAWLKDDEFRKTMKLKDNKFKLKIKDMPPVSLKIKS